MNTGFLLTAFNQPHVRLFGTEQARRSLMRSANRGSLTCLLMGRLYYRHELLKNLGLKDIEWSAVDDAELALRLYEQKHSLALQKLEGDFCLLIVDCQRQKLILHRDFLGGYPLFYRLGEKLSISNSLPSLFSANEEVMIDPEFVAEYLAHNTPRAEPSTRHSVYANAWRVLPGEIVEIEIPSGRVRRFDRAPLSELLESHSPRPLQQLAEELDERLTKATRERMSPNTLCHFSGGMDSTIVTLLAQRYRASEGQSLQAVSLEYQRFRKLGRETEYIEAAIGLLDSTTSLHRIEAGDALDFDAVASPAPHDEPFPALWRGAMDRIAFRLAEEQGCETILTGFGADEFYDRLPYHLRDLLHQGRIISMWSEAKRYAVAQQQNAWNVVTGFALESWLPSQSQRKAIPSWIHPTYDRDFGLSPRTKNAFREIYTMHKQTPLSAALHAISCRAGDAIRWCYGSANGIRYAHPFLDKRVIAIGLEYVRDHTADPSRLKPMLADAFRDLLPDAIRHRRAKGHFDELFHLGLSRNANALRTLVRQSAANVSRFFNPDHLSTALEQTLCGAGGRVSTGHLCASLSLIAWLEHHNQWRRDSRFLNDLDSLPTKFCTTLAI